MEKDRRMDLHASVSITRRCGPNKYTQVAWPPHCRQGTLEIMGDLGVISTGGNIQGSEKIRGVEYKG